jgi:HAE1 family hydrophobic/amphiphilic exporter-1
MVIAIVTVIVGAVTIAGLPIAQFPNIAPPEVQILATYVGADAQTLEQSVATPIEQQMSSGQHELHVFNECDRELADHPSGGLRHQNRSQ